MLRNHVCPKCQHNRLLHIAAIPDQDETGVADLYVAKLPGHGGFFSAPYVAMGRLTAVVCRNCGYTELYTVAADKIRIDGQWVRELVGPEPSGPYR